ncbi:type IV pilus modification PilV family protein [Dyella japonica]|uniref:type IV pilus modification PilV family protein n=1 Tax=Dyella japonica TaxID=231455 RepID=UPI0006859123|nr:hypothetical protein [Dyella japonica]
MNRRPRSCRKNRGIVMMDALVAIVIFSIGILGLMHLLSAAVGLTGAAKYRTDAAMLADQVIAQMWTYSNAPSGTIATNFNSPDGAAYKTWAANVTTLTANSGLPGAKGNVPTIVVDGNNNVTVTIKWQSPDDNILHTYVASTQIQP